MLGDLIHSRIVTRQCDRLPYQQRRRKMQRIKRFDVPLNRLGNDMRLRQNVEYPDATEQRPRI